MASTIDSQDGKLQAEKRSEVFARHVRSALASLYDLPYLQSHPLAALQPESSNAEPNELAQMLQHRLLDGIEHLRRTLEDGATQERALRRYELVRLRYVEGFEVPEVCNQIGCSRTDFYRQLNLGLNAITAFLRTELTPRTTAEPHLIGLGREMPLVGRKQELELMKAAYDAAASGAGGSIIMISGEQGIGKTRLAHELGHYAQKEGGIFLEGRWAAWEGKAPYGAVAEALRQGLRSLQTKDLDAMVGPYRRDLARLFPEIVEQTDAWSEDTELSPEEQQLRLYEGVSALVSDLCQMQPVVMFLDDLHLSPQMSIQLHIARRLREYRLIIVYAFREDELIEHPVLVAGRNELIRSRLVTDMRLSPLTEAETGMMIAHAFGDSAAAQLHAPVYAINKGNPFFIEELLRYLVENRAVRRVKDHWEVLNATRVGIPESVKLLIQERAARLGEEVSTVLQQAAVLGKEFSFAALSFMSSLAEDRLVELLDQGMAAGFLVDRTASTTEERYSFKEDHIREVLYQIIPAARRRRYHLQVGQALNALYPRRLDELAYHFTHGSDVDRGATYSHQAAERESSLFHWNRALPLYQDALDLWDESGGHLEERATVAEKLGDACYKFGIEVKRAVGYLRQALNFYEQLGNQRKIATIHSQLGREYMHSGNLDVQDLDFAIDHFNFAKDIFDREAGDVPHGLVYCGLSMAHQDRMELNEAISWASRALDLGEQLDANAIIANASASLGSALAHSAVSQGKKSLEQGWERSLQSGLGFQADLSRACGARAFGVVLKDPQAGFEWIERSPDYHTTYSLFDIPSHLVALHTLHGNFEEAARILGELQSSLRALGQPILGLWPDELALLWIRTGELDRAESRLLEAFDWAMKSKNRVAEVSISQKLGEVYLASSQWVKAERYLLRSMELIKRSNSVAYDMALLPYMCELYLSTSRLEKAKDHLADVRSDVGDANDWGALKGDMLFAEGLVSAASLRWDDAEGAFGRAIRVYQEYALPWDEAKARYQWAMAEFLRSRLEVF